MIKEFIIAGLGSFIGGGLRFIVSHWIHTFNESSFPLGTLVVNILGCLLIGIFYAMSERCNWVGPDLKLFLTIGLCGGFTTFSTFINENILLFKASQLLSLSIYLCISLIGGVLALSLGYALTRYIHNL